jgi:hypothetical protein
MAHHEQYVADNVYCMRASKDVGGRQATFLFNRAPSAASAWAKAPTAAYRLNDQLCDHLGADAPPQVRRYAAGVVPVQR